MLAKRVQRLLLTMLDLPFSSSSTGIIVRARRPLHRWRHRIRRLALLLFFMGVLLGVALSAHPYSRRLISYVAPPGCYMVPVSGVGARDLTSTFGAPRSGGRKHKGVDIFADRGTAVLSATDGVVWRVGRNRLGGRTVTVLGEGLSFYYYAHLDAWAPGLAQGTHVRAGEPLGAVGNTGNAIHTPTHLHFSVTRLSMLGKRRSVDPVPVLSSATTMPGYELEHTVPVAGNGKRLPHPVNDWSGEPCDLPRFTKKPE